MCQEAFLRGRSSDQINKVGDNVPGNGNRHARPQKATEAGLRAAVLDTPSICTDKLTGLSSCASAAGPTLPFPASFPQASHSWKEAAAITPED